MSLTFEERYLWTDVVESQVPSMCQFNLYRCWFGNSKSRCCYNECKQDLADLQIVDCKMKELDRRSPRAMLSRGREKWRRPKYVVPSSRNRRATQLGTNDQTKFCNNHDINCNHNQARINGYYYDNKASINNNNVYFIHSFCRKHLNCSPQALAYPYS